MYMSTVLNSFPLYTISNIPQFIMNVCSNSDDHFQILFGKGMIIIFLKIQFPFLFLFIFPVSNCLFMFAYCVKLSLGVA